MERQKFANLEGARALLAWWVVFSHTLLRSGFDKPDLIWPIDVIRSGNAVKVFMILSGFVITHLVLTKQEQYPLYIYRRFMRLFPVFFVTVAGFLAVSFTLNISRLDWANMHWHVLAHLFMMHGAIPEEVLPNASSSIVGPAWSISLEWQFYLLAPLIIGAVLRPSWWLAVALVPVAVFSIPSGLGWQVDNLTWSKAFLPASLHWFLLGIGSYFLIEQIPGELRLRTVALCVMTVWLLVDSYPLCVWTAFLLSFRCKILDAALSSRVLTALGQMSYSTYMVHIPIIAVAEKLLFLPLLGGRGFPLFLCLLGTVLVCVPVVSYLLYRFVEKPPQNFARRGLPQIGFWSRRPYRPS